MSQYAVNMREHIDLELRVSAERLMSSELEIALFDLALSYDVMPHTLVRVYHDEHLGQSNLIEPLALLLPRLMRYHALTDEAKSLDLAPTGPLLTRLRLVNDACEMVQACIIYSYIALLDTIADVQWELSQDTRNTTYAQHLARAVEILDEAIATTEKIVVAERVRQQGIAA